MGVVMCKPNDAIRKTRRIDSELRKDEFEQRKKLKFLLLGTSDAGKSTIVKQMRLIYSEGFNDTEIINAIFQIRLNIIDAFKQICLFLLGSEIEIHPSELSVIRLFAYDSTRVELMQESDELNLLNSVRFYTCINEFFRLYKTHPQVPDNIFYFFPQLPRILMPNYVPKCADVINMRVTTLGVHEISFDYRNHVIRLIDVGGQKTERRKWIHFFEGVTAVMFVTSLSCFDQFIEEDSKPLAWETVANKSENPGISRSESKSHDGEPKNINRLLDSIQLFTSVQQNNFLHKSSFMLFLNKKDVLRYKLKQVKFSDFFPNYQNWFKFDNEPESVSEYIESLFRKGSTGDRKIYSHFTEAVDTNNIQYVFNIACDVIFQQAIDNFEFE